MDDDQTLNILAALGEQTAQNFMHRRRIAELEEELKRMYAREEDRNEPTPIKSPDEVAS